MPKLYNKGNDIALEINLIKNDFLDVQKSRHDYENWVPFEFVLNVAGEEYAYKSQLGATFSVYEIHNLIISFEEIAEKKLYKQSFEKFEFSSSECYFDIIVYDPFEDEEIYTDIWINMGTISNGETSGYDKGFRFVVKLDSFLKFTRGLKVQLENLLNLK